MKKIWLIKIGISFSLLVSMLNFTTVKASGNMTLLRNDLLTSQSFEMEDDSYFITNDISTLNFAFLSNYSILQLSGDLDVDLTGDIESINTDTCSGFIGFFEGELEDSTPLSINLTYSNNEMLAALTIGYIGDECFGTTYFGETSDNIKRIDDAFSKSFISENNLNYEQTVELNENALQQSSVRATSLDGDTRLQGSTSASQGGYLSVYHSNETIPHGNMNTTAKVNTNRNGVRTYLSGKGYNTTAIYIVPVQFDVSIKSSDSKLVNVNNAYTPQNNKTTFTIPIPYVNKKGEISVNTLSIVTSSITVTTGYTSGAYDINQFTWVLKKTGGWGQTEFDGNSSSSNGMACKVTFSYQGSASSVLTKNLTCTGKIKYYVIYYPDPEDDTQKTLTLSTSQMTVNTSVDIVP